MSIYKAPANLYENAAASKDEGQFGGGVRAIDMSKIAKERIYTPQIGSYVDLHIIPAPITNPNHPDVLNGKYAVGDWVFSTDLWVHRGVGAGRDDIICPKKNFHRPCPICEKSNQLYQAGRIDDSKSLKLTRRSWLNVVICDPQGNALSDVLAWEVSYALFTSKLLEAAMAEQRGRGVTPFADPQNGSIITFHIIEESIGKNKFADYDSFRLTKRANPISDEVLMRAISFDSLMQVQDEKFIENILQGVTLPSERPQQQQEQPPQQQPPQQQPQGGYPGYATQQSAPQQPAHQNYQMPPPQQRFAPPAGQAPTPVPQQPAYAPSAQQQPIPQQPAPGVYAVADLANAPTQQPVPQVGMSCPNNHVFGRDCDAYPRDCGMCEMWQECTAFKMTNPTA
jgi:hypothetical protein